MKKLLRKLTPKKLLSTYHFWRSAWAAVRYRFPSRKLIVIGVTGTKGKTTSANFIWSVLQAGKIKTGLIGTANINIGTKQQLNNYHMTMPGPSVIQSLLRQMVEDGCQAVVMEVTSEGILQHRHRFIDFDFAVFTNLTPEHLPSHDGSFAKYKQAKMTLFHSLKTSRKKNISSHYIGKTIIANADSEHAPDYLKPWANKKFTYSTQAKSDFQAQAIRSERDTTHFALKKNPYQLKIIGEFNIYNALPAIIIGKELNIPDNKIKEGLLKLTNIPGRMEVIDEGQSFSVIVDYAHEKESMTVACEAGRSLKKAKSNKLIVLLGAEGGGRDKAKRPLMGEIVGRLADYVVVSNVDPYEDNPEEILEDIAVAAEAAGKKRAVDLFVIEDREMGIKKALDLAQKDDIVLITGKGAEQSIVIDGVTHPWDDRQKVREALAKRQQS